MGDAVASDIRARLAAVRERMARAAERAGRRPEEVLLVAVGRGPTTQGLGYDEQGVTMDRGFVITDERLRTNVEDVYAVGDIVPGLQLAHRGFQQGIFVAEEIAGLSPRPIDEARARLLYAALQFFEETGLPLDGAE